MTSHPDAGGRAAAFEQLHSRSAELARFMHTLDVAQDETYEDPRILIKQHIRTLRRLGRRRTQLPASLRRWPLRIGLVERFILKVLNRLTSPSRAIALATAAALDEVMAVLPESSSHG